MGFQGRGDLVGPSPVPGVLSGGTKEYRGLALACLVTPDRYHHLS